MSIKTAKTAEPVFDIQECIKQVNRTLESRLPPADTPPRPLHAAMRYSVFAGGKRLRPLLCLAAARGAGGTIHRALIPAAALEILHTYTLIHDDLPAMDNDTLRRGRPTLHVAFGEANAILAGDALLTLAFEWLADAGLPAKTAVRLCRELAKAAGNTGVIAGQTADLAAEHQPPEAATVA
ncbi:MAG: polyprenyl synthetase family protein, partial [Kiritimatiellia bacterium]